MESTIKTMDAGRKRYLQYTPPPPDSPADCFRPEKPEDAETLVVDVVDADV